MFTICPNIRIGWIDPSVFEFRYFGFMPSGQLGQLPAGQICCTAKLPEASPESFPRIVDIVACHCPMYFVYGVAKSQSRLRTSRQ